MMKTTAVKGVSVLFVCALVSMPVVSGPGHTPTFSIDIQGPTTTIPIPDSFGGAPIEGSSILTPFPPGPPGPNPASIGPLPPPGMVRSPVIAPGFSYGRREIDALSYGRDRLWQTLFQHTLPGNIYFSVDEFAAGIPGAPAFPNVTSEGVFGATEASADYFVTPTPPPFLPIGPVFGNTLDTDGDGIGLGVAGLGLIEPNPPTPGGFPDIGDNLDALDVDTSAGDLGGALYFSMDSSFIDPLEGPNGATAVANGFSGGDVVVEPGPGGPLLPYAFAGLLGLDLVGGFDSDDLDALAIQELGGAPEIFDVGIDLIAFSVRRGSAVIGAPDSLFGAPIEEGDILTLPTVGGFSPFPSILVPAEYLGLATFRSGAPGLFGADDLNALDVQAVPLPAAIWLFGSALLGLVGVGRRKKA